MHFKHSLLSIILAVSAILPMTAQAETIERIAAVAGDEIITINDVRRDGVLRLAVKGQDIRDIDGSDNSAEQLEKLVRELVEQKLIARQAKKNNIHIGDREVDLQLQQMYQSSGHGEAEFKAMIEMEGMDWAAYRAYLRGEIEKQYVIRSELAGSVSPSETDVMACAQEKVPDGDKSVIVTLRQIIIPELEGDSSAGLANESTKSLNSAWWNGLDSAMNVYASGIRNIAAAAPDRFVDYVKQYSTGRSVERDGLLGSFKPSDLNKSFAPVFTLQKNEVSPLITTGAGYHIIRVDDIVLGESDTWKKTVEECREQITIRESQRLIDSWMHDLLEKNYVSIHINDDISGK